MAGGYNGPVMAKRERKATINRREFIAGASAAAVGATLPGLAHAGVAAGRVAGEAGSLGKAVPSFSFGESAWSTNPALRAAATAVSGIPLGGIGAGSVEIRADGYFHDWLIFNMGSWAPDRPKDEQGGDPSMGPGALSLYLWCRPKGGEPQMRRLGTREDQNDLYSLGWVKNVREITFDGRMPTARLEYHDDSLPVEVNGLFFSPFVPLDDRTSGTPGFHATFTLRNKSHQTVDVSLTALLNNPLAWGHARRDLHNTVKSNGGTTSLVYRTSSTGPRLSTVGSMAMAMTGGAHSWIVGEFAPHLWNGAWENSRGFGYCQETFLRGLRANGKLPSLAGDQCPNDLLVGYVSDMSSADKRAVLDRLGQYPVFRSLADRIREVEPHFVDDPQLLDQYLSECKRRIDDWSGKDRSGGSWGSGALCSSITLKPGETKTIKLDLAWHFPHHFSADGPEMGHMYEHWFADAEAVVDDLVRKHDVHQEVTTQFAENLFNTNLPVELPCAWSAQLSTLVKCSWWIKNGRFAIWEGLGCCGFHTTDITYQGSFGILALFPELQKRQMLMGAAYQRQDGRVHHFFSPDLMHVDNGFDRVDMNPQTVMMVCRDYLWTGDEDYLKTMWPVVVKAMASSARLDSDGDGLPDTDTRRNTYDQWDFVGTPSYISSLWLGALAAGVAIADALGERGMSEQWGATYHKALKSFDSKLWNGEYYSLWVNGDDRDECCMSDQLSGSWFGSLSGFMREHPSHHAEALAAVVRHNFSPELGLWNATYPAGRKPKFRTFMNAQATACWTGIEYAMASMLMHFGRFEDGLAIVRCVHDRYSRAGRNWNHTECGDHYYRAMASWATLLAATGFSVDATEQKLTFAPPIQGEIAGPWFASTAYGRFSRTKNTLEFTCLAGSVPLSKIGMGFHAKSVTVNGRAVAQTSEGGTATLKQPVNLKAGSKVKVEFTNRGTV